MAWLLLVLAGLFEVGWAIGLKYTDGFTRLWPTVGTVLAMVISLGLLSVAMKSLSVGTSYAVGGCGRGRHGHPGHRVGASRPIWGGCSAWG
jgi:multidrug transporter EmrE-like cation transporter